MPLKIQLKKGQKIIINGAVLENSGNRTASLLVKNNAAILRDSDILTAEDAQTPASRIYYALQCMYLFPEERARHLTHFYEFAGSYLEAAPSSVPIIDEMRGLVEVGKLYQALKEAQELIAHERKVLSYVQEKSGEAVRDSTASGEPASDGSLGADSGSPSDDAGPGEE